MQTRPRLTGDRNAAGDADTPVAEVVSGRATFGLTSAVQFMAARAKGAPIVTFAAEFLDSPVAFFAFDATKITAPSDFRGLRIPRQRGTNAAIVYDAVLANLGLSRGEIKEKDVAGTVSMLIDRSIDVLPGDIATTSYQLKKAGVSYTVLWSGDYGIHVPGSVYFTTETMLRNHPSIVDAFLQQVIVGWREIYSGTSAIVDLVATTAAV